MSERTAPRGQACQGRTAGRERNGVRSLRYHGPRFERKPRGRPLFTADGRLAGVLERRGREIVLTKRVVAAKHLLRLPEESWAFDSRALAEAERAGVRRVEVSDERGRVWWTSLRHLLERGQVLDRGFGCQVRLPLDQWSFVPAVTAAHRQFGLFEGAAP